MSHTKFTPEFERTVLAALVQDTKFLKEAVASCRQDYFVDQLHSDAAKVILSTYLRLKQAPSRVGLLSALVEEHKRSLKLKKADQEGILVLEPCTKLCDFLFAPMAQVEDVKTRFLEFCRQREMEESILDQYNKLDKGESDPDAAAEAIRRTHQRLTSQNQGGTDFFPDIESLPADLTTMAGRTFTTGFRTLDLKMGGGCGAGTLTTFMAPPKFGKSMVLVNIGYKNLRHGRVVVHFTLEISEKKIKRRYVSRLTGIPMDELQERSKEAIEKTVKFWNLHRPRLFIKEYRTKMATVDTFRSYLYWLESNHGIKPDVVVIDYGDLVRTAGKHEQERFAQGQAYEEMRALAQEFDCAVATASQCNRESMTKTVIRMQDVAEAIQKVCISDHIISICRTEEEDKEGKARLYFAGSREAEAGGIVPIRFHWLTATMEEALESQHNENGY